MNTYLTTVLLAVVAMTCCLAQPSPPGDGPCQAVKECASRTVEEVTGLNEEGLGALKDCIKPCLKEAGENGALPEPQEPEEQVEGAGGRGGAGRGGRGRGGFGGEFEDPECAGAFIEDVSSCLQSAGISFGRGQRRGGGPQPSGGRGGRTVRRAGPGGGGRRRGGGKGGEGAKHLVALGYASQIFALCPIAAPEAESCLTAALQGSNLALPVDAQALKDQLCQARDQCKQENPECEAERAARKAALCDCHQQASANLADGCEAPPSSPHCDGTESERPNQCDQPLPTFEEFLQKCANKIAKRGGGGGRGGGQRGGRQGGRGRQQRGGGGRGGGGRN